MNIKSVALASALALGAFTAQAANTDLGVVGNTIVNSGGIALAPGLINDTFTFSLGANSVVQSNVTSFFGTISPAFYSIVSTGADHMIGGGDDATVTGFAFGSTSASNFTTLAAGDYYFNVFALVSAAPAAYAISASATAAPVPEPETYAMLAAGLGAIGFVVTRRRRQN
jgi:hypothetical protein